MSDMQEVTVAKQRTNWHQTFLKGEDVGSGGHLHLVDDPNPDNLSELSR